MILLSRDGAALSVLSLAIVPKGLGVRITNDGITVVTAPMFGMMDKSVQLLPCIL